MVGIDWSEALIQTKRGTLYNVVLRYGGVESLAAALSRTRRTDYESGDGPVRESNGERGFAPLHITLLF
jgi:hypothetical protein